uniref:Uncharacterized protein n=1 Tax=viral metagenome TaxID=1070528 RepID=A0A6C0CK06_9ZZZZ
MSTKKVELPKVDDDGVVDYLDEDPELPNQRYVIVSFLSPEKVIERKQEYFFQKFIQWMDYDWKVKGLEHFADYISKKYSLKIDDIMKDIHDFEKTHREEVKKTDVPEQYQVFLLKHEKEVQESFDKANNFQCNTRGVKVRRAFPSYEEAQLWCKVLQRKYPKDNLMIGRMGCWLPWEPSEHLMENVEYANSQLNEIMRKYKENEANRELFFAEEREVSIKAQKEENAKRRAEQNQLRDLEKPVHPAEGAMRD